MLLGAPQASNKIACMYTIQQGFQV
jgi:hypothetical protein